VDWNGDGHLDALLGGYAGDVMLFPGKAGGGFHGGSLLTFADGKRFIHTVGKNKDGTTKEDAGAMIWCVDWDQDGDLDILSGWFYGGLFLSRNVGSSTNPKLSATFEAIQSDGKDIEWGYQLQPCMVDWDGDGRKDVIYSSQVTAKSGRGSVSWCRNLSDDGEPRLGPSEVLVWSGPPSQIIAPELGLEREFSGALAAVATDWDGDGKVDLIVSDLAWLSQPLPGLQDDGRKRLQEVAVLMKKQARPDAFAGMTDGESRGVQRELSRERNKVAKSVRRGTTRGRLWLVRRRDQVEQK
tara:strand:- start:102 stop:992 length:891 start_codon:yes stop_codon:yes gene_type:complete